MLHHSYTNTLAPLTAFSSGEELKELNRKILGKAIGSDSPVIQMATTQKISGMTKYRIPTEALRNCTFIISAFAHDPPLIEISNGLLQGTLRKSYNGRIFSSFEGIPYARPPVGDLRFEAPKEPYNWTDTWIANTKHQCLQSFSLPWSKAAVMGDEDCLYINVYVPREKPTSSDNLNVIVHIHGGGFMMGSGHLYAGPEYLMDEDVIFVTMNYRLGPLGFLTTEDDVVPGNNGMKDQTLSLLWIQKNIKYFGGNPSSVTLTGMSAGGASVHLHYFSPLSKGLFHRGFSESGTALDPWVIQDNGLEKTKRLATLVGCPTDSSKEIIDCLRSRSGNKILEHVKELSPVMGSTIAPFAPVIEKENEGAFLTQNPYKALVDKSIVDLPWIVAISEQEEYLFALNLAEGFAEYYDKFEKLAPYILDYNYTVSEAEKPDVGKKIKDHYFQGSPDYEKLGKLLSDRLFFVGADASAKLQAKDNKSPVYFYILGYRGQHSIGEMFAKNAEKIGASHGDSTLYYLRTPVSEASLNDDDKKMKSVFLRWLLSFADDKEPNINDAVEWEPVSGNEALEYLYIRNAENIDMRTAEDLGSSSFWNQLPFKENQNYPQESNKSKDEL
ncbi:Est-6 [Trypoxylus dichotomus]